MSADRKALPSATRMLTRALTRRCPRCGAWRNIFSRWMVKRDRCAGCGIRWRREEGFELGPLALSTIVTFGAVTVTMVIGLVRTPGDESAVPIFVATLVVAVVVPLIVYPLTYLLWLAFDLLARPPDCAERADAAQAVGALCRNA